MNHRSWLDQLVRRFQDRWETNPQYRAVVSGVVGLVLVLTLCACTGLLTLEGNNLLASLGLVSNNSSSGPLNTNTGSSTVQAADSFPTATFGPIYTVPTPVGTVLPSSQTPPPNGTDTPVPTNTPIQTCTTNCGGGGGGGGGGTITASQSPNPWVAGQTGDLIFHTSAPDVGIALIYNLPGCVTNTVEPAGQTDGNGNTTIPYQLESCLQTGEGSVTILANFSGTIVTSSVNVACQS